MGAEVNILPVWTYSKIFPDGMNSDGTPNAQHLDYANIEFECSKNTVIDCPWCIYLDVALPKEELQTCQFFLSTVHDTVLLGHPACANLNIYILRINNTALKFNQAQLRPQLDHTQTKSSSWVICTSTTDLTKAFSACFYTIGNFQGEYHITVDPTVQPSNMQDQKHQLSSKTKSRRN